MAKKLKITLVRSLIGHPEVQRQSVYSLGLKKINRSVVQDDSPSVRGKLKKVNHLVRVEEIEG